MEKNKILISGNGSDLEDKLNQIISSCLNDDKDVSYMVMGKNSKNEQEVEVSITSYNDDEEKPLDVMFSSAIITVPVGKDVECTKYLIEQYKPYGVKVVLNDIDVSSETSDVLFYGLYKERRAKNKTIEL